MQREFGFVQPERADAGRELDLGGLGRTVVSRRWWILLPALLCFVGAMAFVSLVQPRFTAQSKVLVENGENYFTRPDRTDPLATTLPDDEAVQSQIQLVQSRDIARQAIRRLELKGVAEFDPLSRGLGPVSRVLVMLGLERDPTSTSPEDRILTAFADHLTVFSVPKSRVIAIEFTSTDPELAARAANVVADLVIEAQSSAKRDTARAAAASLGSLVTDLRTRVGDADRKADEYRTQSGLLLGSNNTVISAQQLGDINTQLAQARSIQADAQAKARLIKDMIRQNRVGEIPDVANSELIRRISEQRGTLRAEIALQARTLLPGHPHMQELAAQLVDVDNQLRAAGEKQARTLENDARIAATRVENLTSELETQKKTAGAAGADQVQLNTLETQARLLKDQLEFNMQKYQEAVARESAASTPADARIISRASTPTQPTFPKKVPIVAIVTIAGLVLALGLVVARELLSGAAFAPAAQGRAPEPVLASLVAPAPAADPTASSARREGETELLAALENLRGRRSPGRAGRALVLPPSARGDAPAAALDLARRLSTEARTILVEAHGRNPAVATAALTPEGAEERGSDVLGLSDLLVGQASFAEVIHRDIGSRLHVVPAGGLTLDVDMLGTLGLVVNALSETYDYVVMHAGAPTDPVALRLAEEADAIVLAYGGERIGSDIDAASAALTRSGALTRARAPSVHVLPAAAIVKRDLMREAA